MSEQHWHNNWNGARSGELVSGSWGFRWRVFSNLSFPEHAVSNPIMVQGAGPQGSLMMSPKSVGEQSVVYHQMVENVLSSSPGSVNNRDLKFVGFWFSSISFSSRAA